MHYYTIAWVIVFLNFHIGFIESMNVYNVGQRHNETQPSSKYCETQSCKYFATAFLSNLDYELDPCEDFYEFVCGRSQQTLEYLVNSKVQDNIKHLVERHGTEEESLNLSRLRNFYASCNQKKLISLNLRPDPNNYDRLLSLIEELGGFPLAGQISGWHNNGAFDWVQKTIELRQLGLNLNQFFEFGAKPDATRYLFKVDITKANFINDENNIRNLIQRLYPHLEAEDLSSQLGDLVEFRSQLQQSLKSPTEWVYKYSFGAFLDEFPEFDWLKLFDGLVEGNHKFMDNEFFVVEDEKTHSIVKLLAKTKPKVLANHMIMSVIETFAPYITLPDYRLLSGEQTGPKCSQVVHDNLGMALSYEYFKTYVTQDTIEKTGELIEAIKAEFKVLIDEAEWIATEQTKSIAKAKLDSMRFDMGLEETLLDPESFESFYLGLELDPDDYVGNLMKINLIKYDVYLNDLLTRRRDDFEWVEYDTYVSAQANAYYRESTHRMFVMAGFMNSLCVDCGRLASINFGIMGTSIAHEMMHAFDLRGIKRNDQNELCDWCDPESHDQYIAKSECLREQYQGLQPDNADWQVDGGRTLVENMADNSAFEAAYRAFVRWSKAHPEEPTLLRGVPFNEKQLFWVSNGVQFCRVFNEHNQLDHFKHDQHSPPKYRVNIPLRNYWSFAHDFECPINSPMNPEHKCIIWT